MTLMLAVSTGSVEIVTIMLDAKADVHATDFSHSLGAYTALDIAYWEKRSAIMELLKAAEGSIRSVVKSETGSRSITLPRR